MTKQKLVGSATPEHHDRKTPSKVAVSVYKVKWKTTTVNSVTKVSVSSSYSRRYR